MSYEAFPNSYVGPIDGMSRRMSRYRVRAVSVAGHYDETTPYSRRDQALSRADVIASTWSNVESVTVFDIYTGEEIFKVGSIEVECVCSDEQIQKVGCECAALDLAMVAQPVQQAQCNAAPVAAPGAPSEAIETAPRFDVQSALYAYVRIAQGEAPQTVIRSAASIRAKLDPALVVRYRWFRALDGRSGSFCLNAAEALEYARTGVETAPARAYTIDDAERDLADFISRHPEPVSEIASDGPPAATVIHSAQSIRDAINPAHLPRISEAAPDLYSLLSEISRLSVDHDGNPVPVALDEEARDNIRAVLSWCEGLI